MAPARRSPAHPYAVLFVGLVAGIATLACLAAAAGYGPFAARAAAVAAALPQPPPIDASTLFPPVPPVTKVIRVSDPPRDTHGPPGGARPRVPVASEPAEAGDVGPADD